jgi:hypothetical protein
MMWKKRLEAVVTHIHIQNAFPALTPANAIIDAGISRGIASSMRT